MNSLNNEAERTLWRDATVSAIRGPAKSDAKTVANNAIQVADAVVKAYRARTPTTADAYAAKGKCQCGHMASAHVGGQACRGFTRLGGTSMPCRCVRFEQPA